MRLREQAGPGAAPGAPLTLAAVAELCASPWGLEAYSPLGEHSYLVLDTVSRAAPRVSGGLEAIAERLRSLPCPVIAVGASVPEALLRGVDVVAGSAQEVATITANIASQPLAAMTLVQLLRHNEEATPEQGLLAESLAYATLQGARQHRQARQGLAATMETGNTLLVERRGDELHLTLNRPAERNAYSARMRDELYEALQLLKMDANLRRAVIRGAGSCFSTGGDLAEFGLARDPATAHAIRSARGVGRLLLELGDRLEFHLHRACIGAGIELPAFAARVIAASNAFVQLPEIRMGLLPGAGGTVSILRRIGRHRTACLALSARRVKASTALKWGLVDEIA